MLDKMETGGGGGPLGGPVENSEWKCGVECCGYSEVSV
jgi:hypothetical protein